MSSLRDDLDNYLQLRRHLGHDLAEAARLLPRFVDYLERSGQTTITVSHAVAWSLQPDVGPGELGATQANDRGPRLRPLPQRHRPRHRSASMGLVPSRQHWRPPFIYTTEDIAMLLDAAAAMPSPLRSATYTTLFGLLAATGMRLGRH